MTSSVEGIREAAYARWERRGYTPGTDVEDWLVAERQIRFTSNYRVISCDLVDGKPARVIGSSSIRRCRFCGQSSPRTKFGDPVPVFGTPFGAGGPLAIDHCRECVDDFTTGIDAALSRFVADISKNSNLVAGIGIDAFKGLVKIGLSLMPVAVLDEYEEAMEWVSNPDHDFDLNLFRDFAPVTLFSRQPFPVAWAELAVRVTDDEAWPSRFLFIGFGRIVMQVGIPMGHVDEDLDVLASMWPDICPMSPFGPEHDPVERRVLAIRPSSSHQGALRLSA